MAQLNCILYQQVCDLLFDEWDPIGVNASAPRDEYDSYAAGLIRAVQAGADEYKVTQLLSEVARVRMGLSHIDEGRDRRVAKRLIALIRGE